MKDYHINIFYSEEEQLPEVPKPNMIRGILDLMFKNALC
jgi:hypothetical protein